MYNYLINKEIVYLLMFDTSQHPVYNFDQMVSFMKLRATHLRESPMGKFQNFYQE